MKFRHIIILGFIISLLGCSTLNPITTTGFYKRGIANYNSENYDDAIRDFTQVISKKPNDSEVYNMRGLSYYHKGDLDNAIMDFEAALRLRPFDTSIRNYLDYARQRLADQSNQQIVNTPNTPQSPSQ